MLHKTTRRTEFDHRSIVQCCFWSSRHVYQTSFCYPAVPEQKVNRRFQDGHGGFRYSIPFTRQSTVYIVHVNSSMANNSTVQPVMSVFQSATRYVNQQYAIVTFAKKAYAPPTSTSRCNCMAWCITHVS